MSDRRNSIWLSAQFVAVVFIYLLTLKINIINYGESDFGIWLVLISIWSFSFNLDFGIGTAVVRYVSKYKAEGGGNTNRFLSTSFAVFLAGGILLILFGYLLSYLLYFTNVRVIPIDRRDYFIPAFLLYGLAFIAQYLIFFYKSIYDGLSNFVISSKLTIFQNLFTLAGVLAVWMLDLGLIFLSAVYAAVNLLFMAVYYILLKKSNPELKIKPAFFDRVLLKEIFAFSFSIQATNIFYGLIDVVVKNVIANFYQAGFATVYETARKIAVAISGLFFSAFKYILPKVSSLSKREDIIQFLKNDIVKYSRYGLIYSGFALGIMSLPLLLIIVHFFGNPAIVITFLVLAMPEAVNNGGYSVYTFLMGQGKAYILAAVQLINLILTGAGVAAGFILFKNPIGLLGYFISVVIGNILMLIYVKRIYQISIGGFLKSIKVYKLLFFEIILISGILIILNNTAGPYIVFSAITLFSLIVYGFDVIREIKSFFGGIPLFTGRREL